MIALLAGTPPPARRYDADVVILSHLRAEATVAAIRSAAAQTGCDHHVIVLDQNSPAEMRARLIAAVTPLRNVALYGIAENRGVPGGRNLATALGHGRAIIALDNDAVFSTPDVVANAAARLAILPDLGVIGFRILAADGTALDATSWGYPKSLLAAAARRFTTTTFVGCGHALSRACFDGLGGYDASLFFAWEEYEFARRAIAAGWHIEHHGDLAVTHAVAAEARVAWQGERWRYFVRNRLMIAHDWHGYAGMLPRGLIYFARGVLAGRAGATIAATIEAVRIAAGRPRRRAGVISRGYIMAHETAHRLMGRTDAAISADTDASAPARLAPRVGPPVPSGRS
ncbi:glycosyltransferase family 2 protein [Acidiphilium sp.]|uniref:glycosyltransferase family 2 protein n=1 Tax=Acidiphilium sp. TaxID=527 RepID=UPI003D06619A